MDGDAEQLELSRIANEARRIAWQTVPSDRPKFEQAISDTYRLVGQLPPEFIWVNGPVEAWLMLTMAGPVLDRTMARRLAQRRGDIPRLSALDRYLDQLLVLLRAQCGYWVEADLEERMEDALGNSLVMEIDELLFRRIGEQLRTPIESGLFAGPNSSHLPFTAAAENMREELQIGFGRAIEFAVRQEMRRLLDDDRADVPNDEGFFISSLAPISLLFGVRPEQAAHLKPVNPKVPTLILELAERGFWFWPGRRACLCCDRPREIRLDEDRRLHAPDGPAVMFRDGCKLYFHHGTPVPEMIVMEPNLLTTSIIDREPNAEIRRVMIEIYGPGRYLNDSGAVVIDMDMIDVSRLQEMGAMPRALMQDRHGRKWLVGTDGSTKRVYYMRVPDECKTCVQAHNALAGFDEGKIIASS